MEKKEAFRQEAEALAGSLRSELALGPVLDSVRILARYDVEGVADSDWSGLIQTIFAEPPVDQAWESEFPLDEGERVVAVEYLPGQYDQRADSAAQCIEIATRARPAVATATVYVLRGELDSEQIDRIKAYLINPVDSREADLALPSTLERPAKVPDDVEVLKGFISRTEGALADWLKAVGLAMSLPDLLHCQKYFRDVEGRDPTLTEVKLLDTYWSDHCRHSTFLSELVEIEIDPGELCEPIRESLRHYREIRKTLYGEQTDRPVCLMDIALAGMKMLRHQGKLRDLEVSAEINAASIVVPVEFESGEQEEWLVMFKNETHNHPTEIEPFGGAATCLGGAIRDPLSGRSYVYQAMRVTGAADPRAPFSETLPGKLPQRVITRGAARGYSSYGNQIGVATGMVREIYHPGYVAKRMEIGAVIAAAPRSHVLRLEPAPGDVIVLVGGPTGRDGVGGATGSSKEHDSKALENSAEVQKGDPVCERKLQRLFKRAEVARLIKRCNDFGAGGVSVAIGELAPSLEVDLDAVPLKYDGLDGTELALSESQERMAVVLAPEDVEAFQAASVSENLQASVVARVTGTGRLIMRWRGKVIVDISREFLDTNGVRSSARARVTAPDPAKSPMRVPQFPDSVAGRWLEMLGALNHCSQRGLTEMFDSTIGAGSVLHPFGGKYRSTPAEAMAALIPTPSGDSRTATLMSFGFDPEISSWSPFHGAICAVVDSIARVVAAGGCSDRIYLTFQEYFERLRDNPERWGKPVAALLGALEAQRVFESAAIGGKDSMSGSFNDLDVPPTLVSFSVSPVAAERVRSPEFKAVGHLVYWLRLERDRLGMVDLEAAKKAYDFLSLPEVASSIRAARAIRSGGIALALTEMAFGNRIGVDIDPTTIGADRLFQNLIGDLILEIPVEVDTSELPGTVIGRTTDHPKIFYGNTSVGLGEAESAWKTPLESVFPTVAESFTSDVAESLFDPKSIRKARVSIARPLVAIPVFPGTNCEFDTARAFEAVGARAETLVFRNRNSEEVEASLAALEDLLERAQILMLPGGFSSGDEPGGSGKFIAAVFRNERIAEATMKMLADRDGLALGICNGFQALIKLGLLPHGEIRPLEDTDPTLTSNLINRHVSCYVRTKIVSKKSPWFSQCELGEEHMIAVSHGEGRFVASKEVIAGLAATDQIATQYVDERGKPTILMPDNPNGSFWAVEGITSPCGRVLGKMGHSERAGKWIGVNVPGPKVQPIFAGGVAYFS